MSVFQTALDALFSSPLALAADYYPAAGMPVKGVMIVWAAPDEAFAGPGAGAVAPARTAQLRATEIADPQEGDSLVVAGVTYTVASRSLDRLGLLWRLELE